MPNINNYFVHYLKHDNRQYSNRHVCDNNHRNDRSNHVTICQP